MTGRPKPCQVCGVRPPAMREIPCCFDCWPGGPVTPPPCRRCGSRTDYYTSGLCARCHSHAPGERSAAWRALLPHPPPRTSAGASVVGFGVGLKAVERQVAVGSCPDCRAWGTTRTTRWTCKGCASWQAKYPVGRCVSCRRLVAVDPAGGCRLCRRQRALVLRDDGRPHGQRPGLAETNRHGQQLFLADMFYRAGHRNRRPCRDDPGSSGHRTDRHAPAGRETAGPGPAERTQPLTGLAGRARLVEHRQLLLFPARRDLPAGLRRGFLPPADPELAAVLHAHVRAHAAAHGWGRTGTERAQRAVRILLGTQDTPGAPIPASDVLELRTIGHPVRPVLEVLTAAGVLAEDREPAVVRWFTAQTADLPAAMRAELTEWMQVMRDGSITPPRRRPRSDQTVRAQLNFALPVLRSWAQAHPSLREIGRDDVLTALPAAGPARTTTLQGLRSIFTVLKGRRLVFVNPTARISVPNPHPRVPDPLDLTALRAALNSEQPVVAALAALLAFHAVRVHQLRRLRTTDLHDGRLHLPAPSTRNSAPDSAPDGGHPDHVILLAEPVRRRLTAWLDHRTRTWPGTANTHLFIHHRNAGGTSPVTPWWIRRRLGMSAQAIRLDRILDEAHATGGDVRALCDLFGLSIAGAYRYTATIGHATTGVPDTRSS